MISKCSKQNKVKQCTLSLIVEINLLSFISKYILGNIFTPDLCRTFIFAIFHRMHHGSCYTLLVSISYTGIYIQIYVRIQLTTYKFIHSYTHISMCGHMCVSEKGVHLCGSICLRVRSCIYV